MIDPYMQAEAMLWAWCTIMHRKHHTKSDNPISCTTYRECGKCGSYVVSRNRKLERAKEQKDFERQRALVRTVYAPNLPTSVHLGTFKGKLDYKGTSTITGLSDPNWPDVIE